MPYDDICPLCGNSSSTTVYNSWTENKTEAEGTFRIVACCNCGQVRTCPRLSAGDLMPYYADNYYDKDSLRLKSLFENDLPFFSRADRLKKFRKGGTILDVGCGSGMFLGSLDARIWNRYGVEISSLPAQKARNQFHINIFEGELIKAQFPDNMFDVVTLWHVFEHLPNPADILSEIRRILKRHGLLLIAVPNFDSIERRLTKSCWYHLDIPRHQLHYSPTTLGNMLSKAGFRILKVRHSEIKNWYGFLQSSLNALGIKKDLLRNWLTNRSGKANITSRDAVQLGMTLLALPAISLFTLALTLLENGIGMGGTFEMYAEINKSDNQCDD